MDSRNYNFLLRKKQIIFLFDKETNKEDFSRRAIFEEDLARDGRRAFLDVTILEACFMTPFYR